MDNQRLHQIPLIPQPTVKLALITLAGTFVTSILALGSQWIAIMGQTRAAAEAREVKETLATKSVVTDDKLDSIHVLVNSDMGKQKLRTAQALRRIANMTKMPLDIAAAEDAEMEYSKHQRSQAIVDTKQPGGK